MSYSSPPPSTYKRRSLPASEKKNGKGKSVFGSFFGGLGDALSEGGGKKRFEISTPYDPVHLTHVGFNSDTGEFTGLPKEWQQLLSASGISKQEQEAHPQAIADIVRFYQ
ncbi:PBD-domain-containing protein, partial [Atractiella rhizophila]